MKALSGIMLTLMLITSMLTLASNVQPVKAEPGTIYIWADGSVEPSTAPIQRVGDLYTLTNNIYDSIEVQRSNIIIDGKGYTVQGTGSGSGILLIAGINVTVINTNIKDFDIGVYLAASNNSAVSGNTITNTSDVGVYLAFSSNNTISGNTITNNSNYGVNLAGVSSNNKIYHNNFLDNLWHAYVDPISLDNVWDDDDPSGGNYWSDYTGVDANGDGIGDTPYTIDGNNSDRYPLVNQWGSPIYVRADGSVYPCAAPIHRDRDIYTLTDDISNYADGITIERNDMMLDVAGFTLQGMGDGNGIGVWSCNNVTIKNMEIRTYNIGILLYETRNTSIAGSNITNTNFGIYLNVSPNNSIIRNNITYNNYEGLRLLSSTNSTIVGNTITNNQQKGVNLDHSSNNTVSGNTLTNNYDGISLDSSSNNTMIGNSIRANNRGIYLEESSNNSIHHNDFIDNSMQVYDLSWYIEGFFPSINIWDDGYPSGGNYWSDYTGVDLKSGPSQDQPGSDGIGDTAYVIDANNQDNYPLIYPYQLALPLTVTATASPVTIYSGGTSTITFSVMSGGTAITAATISLTSSQGGAFSAVTDNGNGTYTATFTAPDITAQITCTIGASFSKSGYTDGSGQTQVTVQPLVLNIIVKEAEGNPLAGATVVSTSQPSGQTALSGTTDANGLVTFTGILKGSYTIKASKSDYEDNTWTGTVAAGQATTQTITLATPFPWTNVIISIVAVVAVVGAVLAMRMRRPKT